MRRVLLYLVYCVALIWLLFLIMMIPLLWDATHEHGDRPSLGSGVGFVALWLVVASPALAALALCVRAFRNARRQARTSNQRGFEVMTPGKRH